MIITSRLALTVPAAVLAVYVGAYASEAGRPAGMNPPDTTLASLADGQRLFDLPAKVMTGQLAVSGDSSGHQPAAYSGNETETLVQFNGVLSHNDSTEIWLDGVPMSLWVQQQRVPALSVRWLPAKNALVVRLPGGLQRRLTAGQRLYKTANGELRVGDSAQ